MRILIKNQFVDEDTKFLIEHNEKNVINLESSSEGEASCHCNHGKDNDNSHPSKQCSSHKCSQASSSL